MIQHVFYPLLNIKICLSEQHHYAMSRHRTENRQHRKEFATQDADVYRDHKTMNYHLSS